MRAVRALAAGSISTPRMFAKELGHADYRARPASVAFVAADRDWQPERAFEQVETDFRVELDPSKIV